ncbi:hypothetical protein MPSEU_000828600 [Mayamaea pseudoterrestris]|nr:hypothetical protein MPSEU_000828600 [Mayamaea pseudoterrestris]
MPLLTYSGRPQNKKWVRSAAATSAVPPTFSTSTSDAVTTINSTIETLYMQQSNETIAKKQPRLSGPQNSKSVRPHAAPLLNKHDSAAPATSAASIRDETATNGTSPLQTLIVEPVKKRPQLSGPRVKDIAARQGKSWKRPRDDTAAASSAATRFEACVSEQIISSTWKRPIEVTQPQADEKIAQEMTRETENGSRHNGPAKHHLRTNCVASSAAQTSQQPLIRRNHHSLQVVKHALLCDNSRALNKETVSLAGLQQQPAGPSASSRTWKGPRVDQESKDDETDERAKSSDMKPPLTKIARNKLVTKVHVPSTGHVQATRQKTRGPTVKRIKLLSKQEKNESAGYLKADEDGSGSDAGGGDMEQSHVSNGCAPASNKQYTDHAYRSIAPQRKLHGDKYHGRNNQFHNALVRVDSSKTAICPTFLRGRECTKERCTMRHDVAREHCRPICSYFQHQGMCLRENCLFRHVKLERDALPCPSFETYGYCLDEKCVMMHSSRPYKKKKEAAMTTKR